METIHFLFEAKHRIRMLNALSKVILDDNYASPFDSYMYVLGYITSLTTCSWKIEIKVGSDSASVVAMLVKGSKRREH